MSKFDKQLRQSPNYVNRYEKQPTPRPEPTTSPWQMHQEAERGRVQKAISHFWDRPADEVMRSLLLLGAICNRPTKGQE